MEIEIKYLRDGMLFISPLTANITFLRYLKEQIIETNTSICFRKWFNLFKEPWQRKMSGKNRKTLRCETPKSSKIRERTSIRLSWEFSGFWQLLVTLGLLPKLQRGPPGIVMGDKFSEIDAKLSEKTIAKLVL